MIVVPVIDRRIYACHEPGFPTTGFIIGDRAVMVVDAQPNEQRARLVMAAVAARTTKPIRRLVLTSHKPERTGGAAHYQPYSTIASEPTFTLLMTQAHQQQNQGGRPDAVFSGRLTVDLGDYPVTIMQVGAGYSVGDAVVWAAADKVLFTGGLVQNGSLDHDDKSPVRSWPATIDRLAALGAAAIIPGFGAPAIGPSAAEALIRRMRNGIAPLVNF